MKQKNNGKKIICISLITAFIGGMSQATTIISFRMYCAGRSAMFALLTWYGLLALTPFY